MNVMSQGDQRNLRCRRQDGVSCADKVTEPTPSLSRRRAIPPLPSPPSASTWHSSPHASDSGGIVCKEMAACAPCSTFNPDVCIQHFNPPNVSSVSDDLLCHFEPNPRWVLSMLCYRDSIIGLVDLIQGLALVATFISTLMRYAFKSSALQIALLCLIFCCDSEIPRHHTQDEHEQDPSARRCQGPRPGAIIFNLHSIFAIDMLYAALHCTFSRDAS